MPSYTFLTRVVLHHDNLRSRPHHHDAGEYGVLHLLMHAAGYRRFYIADSGTWYHLPPAEYHIVLESGTAQEAISEAMRRASAAARTASSPDRFSLVIQGAGIITSLHLPVITRDPDA